MQYADKKGKLFASFFKNYKEGGFDICILYIIIVKCLI